LNDNVPPTEWGWERRIPAPPYSDTPLPPPNVDLQTGESLIPTETTALAQKGASAAVEPRPVLVDNQVSEGASEPLMLRVPRSQLDLWRARQSSVPRPDATNDLVTDPLREPADAGEPDEDSDVTSYNISISAALNGEHWEASEQAILAELRNMDSHNALSPVYASEIGSEKKHRVVPAHMFLKHKFDAESGASVRTKVIFPAMHV